MGHVHRFRVWSAILKIIFSWRWSRKMITYIPIERVNGSDCLEKPLVPLPLTAATRNWYQCPGRSEFLSVTLVLMERCLGTQLLSLAGVKCRPTWCRSSSMYNTGSSCTNAPTHSTTTVRPLRRSDMVKFLGIGGNPEIIHKQTYPVLWSCYRPIPICMLCQWGAWSRKETGAVGIVEVIYCGSYRVH